MGSATVDLTSAIKEAVREAVREELSALAAKRMLTVEEAAEYTGLTERAIKHKVSTGKMPVVKVDRTMRFDRHALDRWIDDNSRLEA